MTEVAPVTTLRVRIWDVPTRLVHWLMVVLIPTLWWTAEIGRLDYHRYSGYALLGLVVFRLYWGVVGSSSARFSRFVKGPRTIWRYLRGESSPSTGHNPLGALSVVALLSLLVFQITLGLFAVDVDAIESGPLSHLVSFDVGRACAELHDTVFDILVWIVALHVVAVLFYVIYKKQNLLSAMVHGRREYSQALDAPIIFVSATRVAVGIVLAAALTWLIARGFEL